MASRKGVDANDFNPSRKVWPSLSLLSIGKIKRSFKVSFSSAKWESHKDKELEEVQFNPCFSNLGKVGCL